MTTTTTTTADATTAIGGGEILSTAQLRAEANNAEAVLEAFTALIGQIGAWANALPERYVAAPFGTEALSTAVNHVTEAGGDATAITEALTEMVAALDEADGLGETVSEMQADGRVDAFTQS
jgi:hypothetical protein